MKLLFDLFPVILFFASFKGAESFPAESLAAAQALLGSGVGPETAPVFIATAVAIAATVLQVLLVKMRGRRVEPMLWISLGVIIVFGSLTLYLRNELFIKWKPTILYWIFAAILIWGDMTGRNFIRTLMKEAVEMADGAWRTLQRAWILFLAAVGIVNLAVAYTCTTDFWVSFKLFGLTALTFLFPIGMALWMTKHAVERQNDADVSPPSAP